MQPAVVSLKGIRKSFSGIEVLHGVDLDLVPGEVRAIVGENGAGKSTLMKIASGIHQPDEGSVLLDGAECVMRSPSDAIRRGVAMVHQELSLSPDVSVAENMFAGREPRKGWFIDWAKLNRLTSAVLADFDLDLDPTLQVSQLGAGHRQVIEILKALVAEPRVLIFDEPTSSLEPHETSIVLDTIRRLAGRSIGIAYISHRMDEIFRVSDRITVLRDGCLVDTWPTKDVPRETVVNAMVGREMTEMFPPRARAIGSELLRVERLSRSDAFQDIGFSLFEGEILGFSGLMGCGRTDAMRAVFGADPADSGTISVSGRPTSISSVSDAVRAGIAYLPEERKTQGLFLDRSVEDNIVGASLSACSKNGLIRRDMCRQMARDYFTRLGVRATGTDQEVGSLSGGNQQKVLLARWIATHPRILIVDEPTRGVDVGAKAEIHRLLRQHADAGNGVIVISSDMTEIIGLCDRVIVLHEGRVSGEISGSDATEERLIDMAVGHVRDNLPHGDGAVASDDR